VRQEEILPPDDSDYIEYLMQDGNNDERAKVSKEYKKKLNERVYETYPFLATKMKTVVDGKNKTINVYRKDVPGKSDLYVYFQLLSPSLLNTKGTFCFIISNSWLDVEFGAFVQHFLLKHTDIYAIYDSNVRSFSAKINTIIYLHSALKNTSLTETGIKNLKPSKKLVHFILNKAPYHALSFAPILIEQMNTYENTFMDNYRSIPISQFDLYSNAFDDEEKKFVGDKWGGKYLRAPEIFYTILEKGKEKLIPLKHVANIKYGIKTGANDFFILTKSDIEKYEIEQEFLHPIIKNSNQISTIKLDTNSIEHRLLVCNSTIDQIKHKKVYRYIKTGMLKSNWKGSPPSDRSSCKNRKIWYSIQSREKAIINCNYMINTIMKFFIGKTFVVDNFQEVHINSKYAERLLIILSSSLFNMFVNIVGRVNFGQGLIKIQTYELANMLCLNPDEISLKKATSSYKSFIHREIKSIFEELGFDKEQPIRDQEPNPLPDRKELDDIVFDAIGLTSDERKEVYWSVAELVKNRLDRAKSR
jgi:hypothetical protein